jgi:hypothetical protein
VNNAQALLLNFPRCNPIIVAGTVGSLLKDSIRRTHTNQSVARATPEQEPHGLHKFFRRLNRTLVEATVERDEKAYSDGARSARQALAEGVPRWTPTTDVPFGQMIYPETGLPILGLGSPSSLAVWRTSFAQV